MISLQGWAREAFGLIQQGFLQATCWLSIHPDLLVHKLDYIWFLLSVCLRGGYPTMDLHPDLLVGTFTCFPVNHLFSPRSFIIFPPTFRLDLFHEGNKVLLIHFHCANLKCWYAIESLLRNNDSLEAPWVGAASQRARQREKEKEEEDKGCGGCCSYRWVNISISASHFPVLKFSFPHFHISASLFLF